MRSQAIAALQIATNTVSHWGRHLGVYPQNHAIQSRMLSKAAYPAVPGESCQPLHAMTPT